MKIKWLMIVGMFSLGLFAFGNLDYDIFAECDSLPCDDDGIQLGEPNYRFIDFSYQNKVNTPITFILEKIATNACNSYTATITDENKQVVWTQFERSGCVISSTSLTISQIKLGYNPSNPIVLSESAKYLLKVQIDDGNIQREFVARHNISGISLDRTVYPVPSESNSPPKLDNFASELWYEHDYIIDGTILDIQGYDEPERTYNIEINSFFKPSEGKAKLITVHGSPNFYTVEGDRGVFFITKQNLQWEFGNYGTLITSECGSELVYHDPLLSDPTLSHNTGQYYSYLTDAVVCYPHYYKKYLPEYMKFHGLQVVPPLVQQIDGVSPDDVVCNDNLELIKKHNQRALCVTHETKVTLMQRGWMFQLIDVTSEKTAHSNTVEIDLDEKGTFQIPYFIKGAEILEITSDIDALSVIITLDDSQSGYLDMMLSEELVDIVLSCDERYNPHDDNGEFFVIIDGKEVSYEEIVDSKKNRTVLIPFEENSTTIEILVDCLV